MNNLLVTGGSGFIGNNFVRYLLEEPGFEGRIINLDKLTYAGHPENLEDVASKYPDRYIFRHGDICDREGVENIFREYEIDAVCHFAAESHVDRSIINPDEFIETNVRGTHVLLEAARRQSSRFSLFHHVGTDEVYGSLGKEGSFDENSPYRPNSPYAASKAASDHLVRAYNRTYGLPTTITNCSNNYGPYQFPEKLIPLMILNALEGKPLPVYGDGRNVRDWLFVLDHARAIWRVMTSGQRGETYCVGGGQELENIQLVETLCDLMDEMLGGEAGPPRRELITFVDDRPGHDLRYSIDNSRIRSELGWVPEESFETGLRKTVKWYLENPAWIKSITSGEYRKWISDHYGEGGRS